ncbi:MAG: B12-binding domain-containing radical SAM protein [Planctomycetes bacterium]|nr:B12-binding domain-containing radical SAM protein [Planctomycetota bacterium]MBI3457036.1 B12-binding domain-containing radical SAM protein [Candidatus Rokubacteria bacterium]
MAARRIRKVLLVSPPGKCHLREDGSLGERKHCTPHLGLAYLAANLLKHDYEAEILDILAEGYHEERFVEPFILYGLNPQETLERTRRAAPDMIGISVLFSNRAKESYELARMFKRELPDVPIVMGGQHPSGMPMDVMAHREVDYVLIGECDDSFVDLLEALNGRHSIEQVSGLYYRDNGEVKDTLSHGRPAVVGDGWQYLSLRDSPNPRQLGELSFPAWHLFPIAAYWNSEVRIGGGDVMRERFAVMVSTRGCPWTCTFCTSPLMGGFKGYRKRTNEDVVREIRWLIETFGVEEIQFLDDNFFVSKPRVKSLLRVLAQEFPHIVFSVPAGTEVNALDHEVVDLMAKASFYKVTLAIEAGDQEVQESRIDKNVKLSRVPEMVDYIRRAGLETRALFMIGFPGETRAQIMRTVDLALSLDVDDFYISLCTPLPGTPLYDECVQKGLLEDDFDVDNLRYSVANIKLHDVSRAELESIRRNVWLEYKKRQETKQVASGIRPFRVFGGVGDYENAGFRQVPGQVYRTDR